MATTLLTSGLTMGSSTLSVTGSAPSYISRAWVNFNGQGVIAVRSSGNVLSLTDLGSTCLYSVNFSTAMPDANYSVCLAMTSTLTGGVAFNTVLGLPEGGTYSTTNVHVSGYPAGDTNTSPNLAAADSPRVTVSVFR